MLGFVTIHIEIVAYFKYLSSLLRKISQFLIHVMKKHRSQVVFCVLIFLLNSCLNLKNEKQFVIGFSQCVESDKWREAMLEGMKRELAFHDNLKFIYKQAENDSKKQVEQVKELLNEKIDLLIISPNEAQPLTPIVEEVFKKGIPVIVIDRKVASTLYSAYIGADNYEVGKIAGEYAVSLLNKKGLITEVLGLTGSSPAIERHKGFSDVINLYPDIKIILQINGDWLKSKAYKEANDKVNEINNSDLVFAQNDVMALATKEAIERNGINKPIKIIGIDALPGKRSRYRVCI